MHSDAARGRRLRVVEQGSDVRPVQLAHFDGTRSQLIVVVNRALSPVQLPVIKQRNDGFIQISVTSILEVEWKLPVFLFSNSHI